MEDGRPRLSSTILARVISVAAHPLVLSPITVALATRNLRWTAIIAATLFLPLVAVIARNVRRGAWSDFDVSRHDQRSGLYWAAIPLLVIAALVFWRIGASERFMRALLAVAFLFAAGLIGNRFLKISMHMMFGAFCAVILARVYPWSLVVMIPIVAALAWSRRYLERHTSVEIAVGLLLGAAAGLFAVWSAAAAPPLSKAAAQLPHSTAQPAVPATRSRDGCCTCGRRESRHRRCSGSGSRARGV